MVAEKPFLAWDEDHRVHIKEMDDEHKILLDIANELHEKLSNGESAAVLEQVLKALIDYTTYHFRTEEKLMAAADYPRYRQHKAEHDGFLDTVVDLQGKFRRGDSFAAESVLGVLKDWLFNHVQTVDKYLAVFLQNHHEDSVNTRLEIAYSEVERLSNIIRFAIPKPFLNRLMAHQSSTDDIQFLDEVKLSILFGDIRSYSRYAEKMTSQEILVFLNTLFGLLGPRISENHGFIDKFIGDAIMAIFDEEPSASHAVQAAIDIQNEVRKFNRLSEANGGTSIEFGIGINTGPAVIGLLGSESRFSSTVVGDHVNLAARMEELTKKFHTPILVSHHTYGLLPRDAFLVRKIASVRVRGKSTPTTVYEVFDSDPDLVRQKKFETKEQLSGGIDLYKKREFSGAIEAFQACLEKFPEDGVALEYLKRCHYFKKYPPPSQVTSWQEIVTDSGSIFDHTFMRRASRQSVRTKADVRLGVSDTLLSGVVLDVSTEGMKVEMGSALETGSLIKLETTFRGTALAPFFTDKTFKAVCQVLWSKSAPDSNERNSREIGLMFVTMDEGLEHVLHDLLDCPIEHNQNSCPLSPLFHALQSGSRTGAGEWTGH